MVTMEEAAKAITKFNKAGASFSCTLKNAEMSKDLVDKLTKPKYSLEYQGQPVTDLSKLTITPEETMTWLDPNTLGKIEIPQGFAAITDGNNSLKDELQKIWDRLNRTVSLVHNCKNCGAKLEVDEKKPIFHCKYCGSTYIIGAVQPNSTY